MTEWTLSLELDPPASMRDAVLVPLIAHNLAEAGEHGFTPLAGRRARHRWRGRRRAVWLHPL